MVVMVDSIDKATKSTEAFLWTVFTRFEPAGDIYAQAPTVFRHHLCYHGPVLIDARMKPQYPEEVLCDAETAEKVSRRWSEYFPKGMPMGDSDTAHVC